MAERTKEVGIRLSVKDAEVAKRALAAFGTEGEAALKHIENSARKANPHLLTMSNSIQRGKEYARDFARDAARSFLGPVAAIGTATGAIQLLEDSIERVKKVAETADLAERIGIGIDKLQGLQVTFKEAGNDVEDINRSLQTFTANLGDANGPLRKLFDLNGVKITGDAFTDMQHFADLVRNTRNEEEKLRLVTVAFGKGSKEMADLLSKGGAALRYSADEAHRLGTALTDVDASKAREAVKDLAIVNEKLDAAKAHFGLLVTPLEVSALEGMAGALEDIRDALEGIGGGNPAKAIGLMKDLAVLLGGSGGASAIGGAAQTFGGQKITIHGGPTEGGAWHGGWGADGFGRGPKTILPPADNPAADQQAKRIKEVIDALKQELAVLGLTDREAEISNNLSRAKVEAASKEGKEIAALTGELYDHKRALDANNEAMTFFAQTGESAFEDLIDGTKSWNDILDDTLKSLEKAALQAALLGTGPLAGLLGTQSASAGAPGGILGSILSSLLGGTAAPSGAVAPSTFDFRSVLDGGHRAMGGPVLPGWVYDVGERGPEKFMPSVPGRIIPNHAGGPALNFHQTINNSASDLVEVRQQTVPDERGGLRQDLVVERVIGKAISRPGSEAARAAGIGRGTVRR